VTADTTSALELESLLAEHGRLDPAGPGEDRPRVALNMVASVDGRTTIAGRVGGLTSPADQRLLRQLRSQADAVLVGANTIRREGYGTLKSDQFSATAADQGSSGSQPPLLCIVTRRLDLPADLPALRNPDLTILIITTSTAEIAASRARVEYLRLPDGGPVSMLAALHELHARWGMRRVVCEGGPSLNAHLLTEDCVDDLFLALSPIVSGDDSALTLINGALPTSVDLSLRSHVAVDDFVFLRYQVQRP
jgi:5-amino-6-(5-phosphoribosylamino)uracil reductase